MTAHLTKKQQQLLHGSRHVADVEGWHLLHIKGAPYQRGFQHGFHLGEALDHCLRSNRFWATWLSAQPFAFFAEKARELYLPLIDDEYQEEMRGIADGAAAAGFAISFDEVLAWNSFVDLVYSWWPTYKATMGSKAPERHPDVGHRCSAFIATGSATADGGIVMAHNTWDAFLQAQHFNVAISIQPDQGHDIFMQTAPGWIASMMDFTITGAGLMITETTIDGYVGFDEAKAPEFYRSRKAVQYADDIDGWVAVMSADRNGGYANSWLLGDTKTGEIARYELGLKYAGPIERKTDGVFFGENIAQDLTVRVLETANPGVYSDIRSSGARRVRWRKLLDQHDGRIDAENAKHMIGDHYDMYLHKQNAGSRTLCGHIDQDDGMVGSNHGHPPFYPWGAVDGKVCDSAMAARMSFWGRWGRACGEPFDAAAYQENHPQFDWLEDYLIDRPGRAWTKLTSVEVV